MMERRTFPGTIAGAGLLASQACAQRTAGTEHGFGVPLGFGEWPALVVSDFERAFTDPALPLGANLDREIEASVCVFAGAREAGIPPAGVENGSDHAPPA